MALQLGLRYLRSTAYGIFKHKLLQFDNQNLILYQAFLNLTCIMQAIIIETCKELETTALTSAIWNAK